METLAALMDRELIFQGLATHLVLTPREDRGYDSEVHPAPFPVTVNTVNTVQSETPLDDSIQIQYRMTTEH